MAKNKLFLFSMVTVIGAMTVFLLVAAIFGVSIPDAQKQTMEFLVSWGGVAPERLHEAVAVLIGGSVGFALLYALALTLDALADASIHKVSHLFRHFGIKEVIWSEDFIRDWKEFRNQVRLNWSKSFPDEDIAKDNKKWEAFKVHRGKNAVRASRTLVYFSSLAIVAGFIDLISQIRYMRGIGVLIIGVIGVIGLCYIWADRKASYINEIFLANQSLDANKVPVTNSWQ